jgi:hypothetical protein
LKKNRLNTISNSRDNDDQEESDDDEDNNDYLCRNCRRRGNPKFRRKEIELIKKSLRNKGKRKAA